jgi:hypothetical protein
MSAVIATASDTVKKDQIVEFIHKMIENDHAEIAQPLPTGSERWYLPFFRVYHPKKPGKVRVDTQVLLTQIVSLR